MTLVVDASVALKWFLDEEGRDRADALLGGEPLAAPDFLLLECGNTFAVKARRGQLDAAKTRDYLVTLRNELGMRFWPSQPYMFAAHALALDLQRSAYDCLYLAMAIANGDQVVTADVKFERAVSASRLHAAFIRPL